MEIFCYLISFSIRGVVCGYITNYILKRKGYSENWFWWAFVFQIIVILIVLFKPRNNMISEYEEKDFEYKEEKKHVISGNTWRCVCGNENASYVGTCSCGRDKDGRSQNEEIAKIKSGCWKCHCGNINEPNVEVCQCGNGRKKNSKEEMIDVSNDNIDVMEEKDVSNNDVDDTINMLYLFEEIK